MKISRIALAGLLGTALSVYADTTYTSESAFIAALPSGYYLNNFSSLAADNTVAYPAESFSGGAPTVGYQINASPSGLFVNNDGVLNAVGNFQQSQNVVLSLSTGNVYAVGAEFYLTDNIGVQQTGTIALHFSDGTAGSVPSSSSTTVPPYAFFGIVATAPITSMTVSANTAGFLNMTKLYVASQVPEPAAGLLWLAGAAGLTLARRRR